MPSLSDLTKSASKSLTKLEHDEFMDTAGNKQKKLFSKVEIGRSQSGQILLPNDMTTAEAIVHLTAMEKEAQVEVDVHEEIEGYPIDVARALHLAIENRVGQATMNVAYDFFFGKVSNNTFITVPTNYEGETISVYVGEIKVPGIEGVIQSRPDKSFQKLTISGTIKRKSVESFNSLIATTKQFLLSDSLYRGKAWKTKKETLTHPAWGQYEAIAMPKFADLQMPTDLILNPEIETKLEIALWTPIRMWRELQQHGMSVKRGILAYGYYGTGKSLMATKTANICVENGWTFVEAINIHDLLDVYSMAVRYESPGVVVFAEDIDRYIEAGNLEALNNVIDGLGTKNRNVILVLTTNHIDKIPSSLLRPGRLDATIKFDRPNPQTVERLIRSFSRNRIEANVDLKEVANLLADRPPSVAHELVKFATQYQMMLNASNLKGVGPDELLLSRDALMMAAESMQEQLRLIDVQDNRTKKPSAMELMGGALGNVVAGALEKGMNRALVYRDGVFPAGSRGERNITEPLTDDQIDNLLAAEKELLGDSN